MNVLESFVLSRRFSSPEAYYVLMPDGLCTPSGATLRASRNLAWLLLDSFRIGDPIVPARQPGRSFFACLLRGDPAGLFRISETAFGRQDEKFPFVAKIELPEAVALIEGFAARPGKNVYEKFVEYNIILAFMESLKNSKVMYGGIWFSERPGSDGRTSKGYETFVRSLAEKNTIIERLKEVLDGYGQYHIEEIGKFRPSGPRPCVTAYSRYLENLYLHFLLKNVYQRFYLVLSVMNERDKLKFDAESAEIKRLIASYRG
jgi:hypothetical protein